MTNDTKDLPPLLGPAPQAALAEKLMSLAADYAIAHRAFVTAPNKHANAKFDTARMALRFEVDCLAALAATNASASLTAQPAETCLNPQLAPDRKLTFPPAGCAFLFIQMDDAGQAHLTACADELAALSVVIAALWIPRHELDHGEQQQALEILETLLEDGRVSFEGDPPLYLFRLAAAPIAPTVPIRPTEDQSHG